MDFELCVLTTTNQKSLAPSCIVSEREVNGGWDKNNKTQVFPSNGTETTTESICTVSLSCLLQRKKGWTWKNHFFMKKLCRCQIKN